MARENGIRALHQLVGEADGLVKLGARHIGHRPQVGIADHVQIGKSGETERLAETTAAGRFKIEEGVGLCLGVLPQLRGEIECAEQGCLVFATADEAVGAFVGGVKRPIRLEDDVRLPGDVEARSLRVGKHRWRCLVRWGRRLGSLAGRPGRSSTSSCSWAFATGEIVKRRRRAAIVCIEFFKDLAKTDRAGRV